MRLRVRFIWLAIFIQVGIEIRFQELPTAKPFGFRGSRKTLPNNMASPFFTCPKANNYYWIVLYLLKGWLIYQKE